MTYLIDPDRLAEVLDPDFTIKKGAHNNPDDGMCELEAVAYITRSEHTDHPPCASPVIAAFLRSWNDTLDDTTRQTLKPYIPRLVGTAGTPEQEDQRAWMALDWLVRTYTPAWLRCAGLNDQADTLAGLAEFQAGMDVPAIRPVIDRVRKDAVAAGDAAWAAAWAAAWVAAGVAAGDAARDALTVARDAARDAAWVALGDAAGDAARAAARAAAWVAAGVALTPTVAELQTAAHQLVDRMIAVTEAAS